MFMLIESTSTWSHSAPGMVEHASKNTANGTMGGVCLT